MKDWSISYKLVFTLLDQQFAKLNTLWTTSKSSFNVLIAQNGLRTLEVDESFILVPDFNIIITSMSGILSENGTIYCGLMVSTHNMEPIAFVTKITPATVEFPPSDSTYA